MSEIGLHIRNAISSDRSRLANLIHFSSYIHQHLDWKPPLEWVGRTPYLLIEKDATLLAALACPPDLPDTTWIRLFAVATNFHARNAWEILWEATLKELTFSGLTSVAALSLQGWFNEMLEASEFVNTDNVIVLMWERNTDCPKPLATGISIRPMMPEDINNIVEIDNSAFGPEWRNSLEALELAYQQSSMARVAESGIEIVGYQYSTSSMMGGHLARLAVKPSMQGKGIGYLLVHDVLQNFKKQGVTQVTVNTQQNNTTSIALYTKAGFTLTGESYRVYQYTS